MFDWPRLLKEQPPDPAARRERDPRERDRRERREPRPAPRPRPLETSAAAVPAPSPPAETARIAEAAEQRAAAHADVAFAHQSASEAPEAAWDGVERREPVDESLAVRHGEPLAADHTEYLEFAAASALGAGHPAESLEPVELVTRVEQVQVERVELVESVQPVEASAAAARLGHDGLLRLRARYAEITVRLTEKPMDEPARAELKSRAERLNPDAWHTPDEVSAALEQYEAIFESLRAVVGHYPPRRRRR